MDLVPQQLFNRLDGELVPEPLPNMDHLHVGTNLEAALAEVMVAQVNFAILRNDNRGNAEVVILLVSRVQEVVLKLQIPEVANTSTILHTAMDIHVIVALTGLTTELQVHTVIDPTIFTRSTLTVEVLV